MNRVVSSWIVATVVGYILQCRLGEWGILSLEILPLADSDSPMHEAVRQGLFGGIPLLPVTAFFHGGGLHALLGCASLVATGRLVEDALGGRSTFVLLGAASILGAAAGWIIEGQPTFGASVPFFGLLGALIFLAFRKVLPVPLVWHLSFPLLTLVGLFTLAAAEMSTVSHGAHVVAALVGVVMATLVRKGISPPRGLIILLGALIGLGGILGVLGGGRIARARGVDISLQGMLEGFVSDSPFLLHEDSQGRFRIAHPTSAEAIRVGKVFVVRMKGSEKMRLLTMEIHRRTSESDLDVVAAEIIRRHREDLERFVMPESIVIEEEVPVTFGAAEGLKMVISSSTSDSNRTDIVIVALTEERRYEIATAYLAWDEHGEGWRLRMLDSLEILK